MKQNLAIAFSFDRRTPTAQARHAEAQRPRYTGSNFPAQDAATLRRIANYRTFNLTAGALFAIEMAQYNDVTRLGRSARKPAAE